jgi:hypothetical protein
MADEDQVVETESGDTGEQTVDETSTGKTAAELSGFDAREVLSGMVSDADVHAIFKARSEGKTPKVVVEEDIVEDTIEDVVDTEELSEGAKQVMSLLDKRLAPLTEEVDRLKGVADGYQKQAIEQQIANAEQKHKDFGKYRKAMSVKAREVPGLSIEQLYLITKHEAGDLKLTEPSTHSEKPTASPRTRPGTDRKKPDPDKPQTGRRAWDNALADALDRSFDKE